jgi:polysaccharide export outer membrane protein
MCRNGVPIFRHLVTALLVAAGFVGAAIQTGRAQGMNADGTGAAPLAVPSDSTPAATPSDNTPPGVAAAPSDGAAADVSSTSSRKSTMPGLPTASSTYRLQPYDLIDVQVYSEEDLHKPARLGSDGTVLLPLIGSVKLGGLTVAEATELITGKYAAGYVKNPSVLITVLEYRKRTFSILGQIVHTGLFDLPEGSHVSIVEAITMAGGFTATAAQNAVTVKRTMDGKTTLYRIKVGEMAQSPDAAPFEILPGDTIDVPGMPTGVFTIYGQIFHPGVYSIPPGGHMSILTALSLGGGFTPTASQNGVMVKRLVDGKQVVLIARAADVAQGATAGFDVLPNDSIIVPQRNSSFSILGQVNRPGIYDIPDGGHVDIINAILMAGGYTRTAAQNSVLVKRRVNGQLTTLKIRAGDMAQDPNLVPFEVQPGDIVNVKESWY